MADVPSPIVQASIVLDRAELARLVDGAAEHHAIDCAYPDACTGDTVAQIVCNQMHPREVRRLLLIAVAELATLRRNDDG